jgi:hypothetical protein
MQTTALHISLACAAMALGSQADKYGAASLATLDGLEVAMSGDADRAANGVQLFGISLKQGDKTWIVPHRYNDFKTLKGKLGPDADSLPDAPFPGKFWWPFPSESALVSRREGLEKWLKTVLEHPNSKESWKEPLTEFLDENSEIEQGKSWSQTAHMANASVFAGWKTTTDNLQKWYEDGLAQCQGDERCKAAKDRFDGFAKTINSKTQELKESISSYMVLSSDADKAKEELEELKASDATGEAVKAAEEKYEEKKQEAMKTAEEIQELEEDVKELDEAAKATMEKPLEEAYKSAEL